jgi:hypothetical protein
LKDNIRECDRPKGKFRYELVKRIFTKSRKSTRRSLFIEL